MTDPVNSLVSQISKVCEIRDNHGRILAIRPINALDRLRLLKAAGPELSQNDAWLDMAALVFSVTEINGVPRPTPINERQIEAAVTELGDEGLRAIADTLSGVNSEIRLFEGTPEGNVAGTQS